MNRSSRHSQAFREEALRKVFSRGDRTIEDVASALSIHPDTLKSWMKHARRLATAGRPPDDKPPAERFDLLMQSASLGDEARAAFCRQHGLYVHQLDAWKQDFCTPPARPDAGLRAQCEALTRERDVLKQQLGRKDRALAEAAALLVLSKKWQALLVEAGE